MSEKTDRAILSAVFIYAGYYILLLRKMPVKLEL